MLTPRFHLKQDAKTLTIIIRAPYCSLKELEVQVDDESFLFYCKPYYLRLNLPGKIEENNNTTSSFDANKGEFTFTYDKTTPNETFENLELITKLLCPKLDVYERDHEEDTENKGRKIEVLTSTAPSSDDVESEQQYGFGQRGGYNFNILNSEFGEIFEVNPFKVPLQERALRRTKAEQEAFSFDHYLADFIDCDEIDEIVRQTAPFTDGATGTSFTDDELDFLKDLPNICYELTAKQKTYVMTTLVDIIYAYCYDQRTTWFEGSCESGWTILKLTASFAYFDGFDSVKAALVSGFRRSLTFPLYRNFALSSKVLEDVKAVLAMGECQLVKILIGLHRVFLGGDSARYILNHLFLRDYIIYVQKWDQAQWQEVVDEVRNLHVSKSDLDLGLEKIEEDQLNLQMKSLTIDLDSDDSASSSSSSDSDDSETSSDSGSNHETAL